MPRHPIYGSRRRAGRVKLGSPHRITKILYGNSRIYFWAGMVVYSIAMSALSRTKGATFERAIVKEINNFFESEGIAYSCKRNLDQYQIANLSDIDIPFHAVECKHYKEGWAYKPEWLKQTIEAAGKKIPVLIFRYNRKPIQVCIPMYAINPEWEVDPYLNCVISLDQWFEVMKRNWDLYRCKYSSTS